MLPRQEVQQQAIQMQRDIRRKAQEGILSSHEMLPSLRKLAEMYGVSHSVANHTVQALIEEGIVYSVPRIGIFVGRPKTVTQKVYLLLQYLPERNIHCQSIQIGFEERIAQLGGTSLTLDYDMAANWHSMSRLPPLAGVFEFVEHHLKPRLGPELDPNIPYVEFGKPLVDEQMTDRVYFDDFGGGRQAAQHLWALGHRNIAYLGLHGSQDQAGDFTWSQEREKGWRETLIKECGSPEGLAFQPALTPEIEFDAQINAALEAANALINQSDLAITAVITANFLAAYGLVEALRKANIPTTQWPAIVCFDTDIEGQLKAVPLTTLRLPWEDIGRAAADLLWARNNEELDAAPQKQLVPMRLIQRLTSQRNWGQNATGIEDQLLSSRLSYISP